MECRNITASFTTFNKFYIRVTELFQMNESATWQSLAYSQSIRLVWYEFKCILNISNILIVVQIIYIIWALILLPPPTKLQQGNVFTPVCQSFCLWGVSATLPNPWVDTPQADTLLSSACWDTHPLSSACWDTHPPAQCMLGYTPLCSACWDTVNKRLARILLECILVFVLNFSHFFNLVSRVKPWTH